MDTFIWIYNLPVQFLIFIFNFSFWFGVLWGLYKMIERIWDAR